MSVNVADLISRASVEYADPDFRRTSRAEWLQYYNKVHDKLCVATRCIEIDADFDIVSGTYIYPYPDPAVGISAIRYSETPPDGFLWLKEMFRDEYRVYTDRTRPAGSVWAYHARPSVFELLGTPSVNTVGGGILTYYIKPTRIVAETGAVMEAPDLLEESVVDAMVIRARLTGRDRVAAAQDYQAWVESLSVIAEQIQDRSDDRRPAIRSSGEMNPYGGMT